MSVEEINQDLVDLKEEALDLGIEFSDRIGYDTLKKRVDERLEELAQKQRDKKEAKEVFNETVKVIVEPRDGSDNIVDQFIGFNGKKYQIMFGEEIELPKVVIEFMRSKGVYDKIKKTYMDDDGIPQTKYVKKFKSRFLIERID